MRAAGSRCSRAASVFDGGNIRSPASPTRRSAAPDSTTGASCTIASIPRSGHSDMTMHIQERRPPRRSSSTQQNTASEGGVPADTSLYERVTGDIMFQVCNPFMHPEVKALFETVAPDGERLDGPGGRCLNPGHAIETGVVSDGGRSPLQRPLAGRDRLHDPRWVARSRLGQGSRRYPLLQRPGASATCLLEVAGRLAASRSCG